MMGSRQEAQGALFYEFSIEAHVPSDHTLRLVDQFVDLASIRQHLAPFYSSTGRPPGIGRVRLLRRSTTRSPASSERRSRYSLAILSGSLASSGSDYVARSEPPETGQDPSCIAATAKSLTGKPLAPRSAVDLLRQRTGVFPRNQLV